MARWPLLTIAGITGAVLIGTVHAVLVRASDSLLGTDDLGPRTDTDGLTIALDEAP